MHGFATMIVKIASVMCLFALVTGKSFYCNHENAVTSFKRPTYDFSVRILDRVAQQTKHHFVFSPLSTWLQLMSLAEGARGPTKNEIWTVTRYHRMKCFRRKYREILNAMNAELNFMTRRTNVMVIDKLLDIKKSYEREVEKSNTDKIISVNFKDPTQAAEQANEVIEMNMNDTITDGFDAEDFNLTVLLMTETAYFRSDWLTPFNPVYTSIESFYSEYNEPVGSVKLMSQVGTFNITDVPFINSKVLELPFDTNGSVSMLVFLPTAGTIKDLFYNLRSIRLMTIFHLFKAKGPQLVLVKLPRFKIETEVRNIPELVYDMGVKRIFYPDLADLRGISDFKIHTSLMTHIANIEVTEKGVSANAAVDFLIKLDDHKEFIANRPFAYLIFDRKTEVILFAGMYLNPSIQ